MNFLHSILCSFFFHHFLLLVVFAIKGFHLTDQSTWLLLSVVAISFDGIRTITQLERGKFNAKTDL